MPRCIRCGCPNEQSHPDPIGLALCDTHNTQFQNGTIGQDHNPRQRAIPTAKAQQLLTKITKLAYPGQKPSLRQLGHTTGLGRDTIRHIQQGTWKHIRSHAWEHLQDTWANLVYERDHTPQPGEQLALWQIYTPETDKHGDYGPTGRKVPA